MIRWVKSIAVALGVSVLMFGVGTLCNSPGCRGTMVSSPNAIRAVESQGYSDVRILSSHIFFVSWRGWSGSDAAAYKMAAKNPLGKQITLIACVGWPFKGATIRTE